MQKETALLRYASVLALILTAAGCHQRPPAAPLPPIEAPLSFAVAVAEQANVRYGQFFPFRFSALKFASASPHAGSSLAV